ncbi:MAG: DNA-processing protein DprA [Candidatus Pedobacter colombiensis]|uniref:DNA-processing protein DprA n=1 Tax=Candidatus Pedobacter colombiensis TaxID=3121371 RepID=A0AAJ6B9V7_9SPHI|nr:DNA-processing protein DprA [Pedobacter sp.]WEK20613.1 MAG: DNA-processing protein DprA [Pedobacter sp.]
MSLIHKIGLTLIKGVGDVIARNLLDHFGSAETVFKASKHELMEVLGVGEVIAAQVLNNNALEIAEREVTFIKKHRIKALFYTDEDYPQRLKNCHDAPILLYYKGNADLNHPRIISIVGTRRATAYGKQLCRQLAEVLAPYNVIIVSGLAYGIDVASHKESLEQNIPTIGVMAHGLDRIYPAVHKPVARKMVLNGGLLTEFLPNTNPDKENFPKRNRIIAGLSDATVVVEATAKGGALITADIANSYNRDVYAFPGRTTDLFSEGCNFLIKTNRAALINDAKDLIYYLGWDDVIPEKAGVQTELPVNLSKDEQRVVELLQDTSLRIDELAICLNVGQSKLAMLLLSLEMQGILVSLPGKVYKLN